jgi:hypothetical protein
MKITNTDDLSNVVVGVSWKLTGTDEDDNSGVFSGATPFKLSEVDGGNFTDYDDLTEEVVVGWVQDVVVGSYWTHVEEQIVKQINEKKSPVTEVSELPWGG